MESSRHTLPNEIIYDILAVCIAESIHLNCVSPVISSWDAHCISILSSVSFLFREIVTDVIMQSCLVPRPVNGQSVFPLILDILDYMRELGEVAARPSTRVITPPPNRFQNVPLVQTYGIYVSVANLRNQFFRISRDVYEHMHISIQQALPTAVESSKTIRPKALALFIRSALEDEIALNGYASSIVEQCHRLDNMMYELGDLRGEDDPLVQRSIDAIMDSMHEALTRVEVCDLGCHTVSLQSPYKFTPVWASHQLPDVKEVITMISLRPDMDAHNIQNRSMSLLEKWNAVSLAQAQSRISVSSSVSVSQSTP